MPSQPEELSLAAELFTVLTEAQVSSERATSAVNFALDMYLHGRRDCKNT